MRFTSLKVEGYKRFADPTFLRVRSRSVAILGPNESGKTSLLEALEHLMRDGFPGATQFTDRQKRPRGDIVLSAYFKVEQEDATAIERMFADRPIVGEVTSGQTWSLQKYADGTRIIGFQGGSGLRRNLVYRKNFLKELRRLLNHGWSSIPLDGLEKEQLSGLREQFEVVNRALSAEREEAVDEDTLEVMRALRESLVAVVGEVTDSGSLLEQWKNNVNSVLAEEEALDPTTAANHLLYERMPRFIRFEGAARTLPSFTPFEEEPPASLVNLLAAAESRFEDLASLAARDGGRDALAEEERRIGLRLEGLFRSWTQREVTVAIKIDTTGVEVVGRDRAAPIIDSPLKQRSSGMRMFAALACFLHGHRDAPSRPVLLVDEAEMHLHYDGQADLIRIFQSQAVAQVVIYTTHSIGCLPEDLGLGVVVVEEIGEERSRISQSFWTRGAGLTPLMISLGATALSFTPSRRVLIGEGAHEAILLPSLFRQAVGLAHDEPVGFHIVGSLSEISAGAAVSLEEEAGTVLYLVDNDGAGKEIVASLPVGVRETRRVFVLGEGTDAVSIEDFVSPQVITDAIDAVLEAEGLDGLALDEADVPTAGRADWAEELLSQAGTRKARTRLVQTAVMLAWEGGLVDPNRVTALQTLFNDIHATFPTDGLA